MDQSETYKIIAEGLHACGISKNCALCIILLLETEDQAQAMLDWILELETPPTEQECLIEALAIKQEIPSRTSSAQTP